MNFGAPLLLAAGAVAALAAGALHFFTRQRPRAALFPTARFVPDLPARSPSRAAKPAELLLLALRATALLAIGAAFARPTWERAHRGTARVLLVDRSRSVASFATQRDPAAALFRAGDALVLFDSTARVVRRGARDSLFALSATGARGSLSAALVAAHAAAASVAEGADSVELVLVSPLTRDELDAATFAIRDRWPGGIRIARAAASTDAEPRSRVELRAVAGDPLAGLGLDARRASRPVRIVRAGAAPEDSAWAAAGGTVLVRWPAHPATATDSIGALVVGDDVVVAAFPRLSPRATPRADVIARWSDGTPAATEIPARPSGCIRDVAIALPSAGDLVLRESFRRVLAGILAPCGGARGGPADSSTVTRLRGEGGAAPAVALRRELAGAPPMTLWLLAAALVLIALESIVRRRAA